jgi:hypothetical protein
VLIGVNPRFKILFTKQNEFFLRQVLNPLVLGTFETIANLHLEHFVFRAIAMNGPSAKRSSLLPISYTTLKILNGFCQTYCQLIS